jgi:hydroxyacylglutathione hydrolase
MIVERIVTEPFGENIWILGNAQNQHAIVIDPGDNVTRIIKKLKEFSLTPIFILNTHAHPDHLGAAAELQKRFHLPFAIHNDDQETYNTAKITAQFLGLGNLELPEVTTYFHDAQVLEINSRHIQVLHTPGHTPGSVCFLTGKHLFSGDTLLQDSIGRTDLPGGSMTAMNASLRRLIQLPEDITVYPGHGEITTLKAEIARNPFLQELQ